MNHYDRLATSRPVNRQAVGALFSGEHWQPGYRLPPGYVLSDTPLPTRPVPPDMPALAGQRVDRLVVQGYAGSWGGKGRWVVRCDCGSYSHRTTKFLRSEAAQTRGLCAACDHLQELKARGAQSDRRGLLR